MENFLPSTSGHFCLLPFFAESFKHLLKALQTDNSTALEKKKKKRKATAVECC